VLLGCQGGELFATRGSSAAKERGISITKTRAAMRRFSKRSGSTAKLGAVTQSSVGHAMAVGSVQQDSESGIGRSARRRATSNHSRRNLLVALHLRETAGTLDKAARLAFLEKRDRLSYCLDDLVGTDHPATQSVILGFSADGQTLISYAAANASPATNHGVGDVMSDYCLELWAFEPPRPLRRVLSLPLFNCGMLCLCRVLVLRVS
jgi:hypothetical protein